MSVFPGCLVQFSVFLSPLILYHCFVLIKKTLNSVCVEGGASSAVFPVKKKKAIKNTHSAKAKGYTDENCLNIFISLEFFFLRNTDTRTPM
jgi:hypothetical protein